jgi:hypothetical protein
MSGSHQAPPKKRERKNMKLKHETNMLADEKAFKSYYENPILNRLANTVFGGAVFGESTMLAMMGETTSEKEFVKLVMESL